MTEPTNDELLTEFAVASAIYDQSPDGADGPNDSYRPGRRGQYFLSVEYH